MKKISRFTALMVAAVTALMCMCMGAGADYYVTSGGKVYSYYDNGVCKGLFTGWMSKGADRYYYRSGVMKKSTWLKLRGVRTYYLRKNGKMAVGDVTISGKEYTFGTDGKLISDNFGISMRIAGVSQDSISLVFDHDSSGLWRARAALYPEYVLCKMTDTGRWKRVSEDIDDDTAGMFDYTDIYGRKGVKVSHSFGKKLEAGIYRIEKHITVFTDIGATGRYPTGQLPYGSKNYTMRLEFNVSPSGSAIPSGSWDASGTWVPSGSWNGIPVQTPEFIAPPVLTVSGSSGSSSLKAVSSNYSWRNKFGSEPEKQVDKSDKISLDSDPSLFSSLELSGGEKVCFGFSDIGKPDSVTVRYRDISETVSRYPSYLYDINRTGWLDADASGFSHAGGTRLYDVAVTWKGYTYRQENLNGSVKVSGTVHYYFIVTSKSQAFFTKS